MSQPQIIDIQEIFKDFFGCKFVLAANHLYPGNIQRLFRLQTCLSRKSSISWKYSKTFSPAKLSQQQPINTLKIFKNFFACKIVLVANYRKTGNIRRLFRLQNCLSSNPSKFSKYSKTPSPAKLSYLQIIDILEIFKEFFGCKIVLVATHQFSENIQRLFACKTVLAANHLYPGSIQRLFPCKIVVAQIIDILELFKDFFAWKTFLAATHQYSENIQRLFRLQKCLSRKPSISWKYSKTFSPANLSSPQIIDILEIFNNFFACKNSLAATHH